MPDIAKRPNRRMVHDAAIERWLEEEVGPAYDAIRKDPTRGIPIDEAFAAVRAHHLARVKASGRRL